MFGAAFGTALATAVFTAHGHFGSVASFTAGYRPAMAVSAGLSLFGAGRRHRDRAAPRDACGTGN